MKVLLVHPPIRENALPCNVPLGLAYVAAGLRADFVECQVLDMNVERLFRDPLVSLKHRMVYGGFTHVAISAIVTQFKAVEKIVEVLKPYPVPIIVGGPISELGDRLCRWLGKNVYVFKGEGDKQFAPYLKMEMYKLQDVFTADPVDVSTLGLPYWDGFNMETYARNPVGWVNKNKWRGGSPAGDVPRSMNMSWSRGCPYRCSFCSHCSQGTAYRKRPVDAIIAEMEVLYGKYGIRYFHTSDDLTLLDKSWLDGICKAIRHHRHLKNCTWGCAGRADTIDLETLQMMHKSGCRLVGVGVESGSQAVLESYNKGTFVYQNEQAIRACQEVFGEANYSLIVGSPVETDETVNETIELCKRTRSRPEAVFYLTPMPGSKIYEQARVAGKLPPELEYARSLGEMGAKPLVNLTAQSEEWLRGSKDKIEDSTKHLGAAI